MSGTDIAYGVMSAYATVMECLGGPEQGPPRPLGQYDMVLGVGLYRLVLLRQYWGARSVVPAGQY
eukprot:148892-Rhodomonas_salina.1